MVSQISSPTIAPKRALAPQAAAVPAAQEDSTDRVELGVHLMAGAPTGFLSPQLPPPTTYVVPVGIEFAPGLGISLDGKAILVGHKGAVEKFDIIGHLEDGTQPQRDFKVGRDGSKTTINSKFGWENYVLENKNGTTDVVGETDRESFSIKESATAPQTVGKFPAKTFSVNPGADSVQVTPGYEGGPTYALTQKGATTSVNAGSEEVNFDFTRNNDGSFSVQGKYKFQDFSITPQGDGWLVKGYYPQQKFVIKPE